jgi:hypothetical protein
MGRHWYPSSCSPPSPGAQVLNLNTLYELRLSDSELSSEVLLEKSLVASHSLTVEPRFTSTVSWIVSSSPHRPPVAVSRDDAAAKGSQEGSSSKSDKKKRKRVTGGVAQGDPEEIAVKEPKVRFQEVVEAKEEAIAAVAVAGKGSKKKNKKKNKKSKPQTEK